MGGGVGGSPGPPNRLSAGVVIITYERPDVLRDTMDCWRRVKPAPDQFVVVDASARASDEREAVLADYAELFESVGSDYFVAARPSTTAQRNLGLAHLHTDVVLFTDDESKPEADYVAKIMEVYQLDADGVVGGVGGSERDEETVAARARRASLNMLRPIARRFAPPPGYGRRHGHRLPGTLAGLPVVVVRDLHGAKMSFRTDVARRLGFDTHMLRYAYGEDLDLSIRVGATHVLVQRKDAYLLHDESQRARVPKEAAFLVSWVNPAYLSEKLCSPAPRRGPLWRLLLAMQAGELVRSATLLRPRRRREVSARYALARGMIAYLQASPPGELTRRFDLIQHYIFEVPPPSGGWRLDHFQHWLTGRTLSERTSP